jgi:DNA primase
VQKKGRFSSEWIAQLKQSISLVDVASENIELKKTGNRYMGRCPFHGDRSPSFSVNKDFYYCFGCKETGDVISFVTKLHGLSFEEACEDLAEKAHLQIPESAYQLNSEEEKALYKKRVNITKGARLNHFASLQYYHKNLVGGAPNVMFQEARDYLKKRGITAQTIENFQIGVSGAQHDGLVKFFENAKAPMDLAREFGLIRPSQKQAGDYDFFRERVTFPLIDVRGRVCGFGGRILPSADERHKASDLKLPKYLNSAESDLFYKSKFLYGLYQAKRAIREEECVILVEGYFDVVSLFQAGLENVVATCGTSLTDDHLKTLSRLAKKVIVFFDSDAAGMGATVKAMELGLRSGVLLYGIPFKGAKDPDEFLLENPVENLVILKKWMEEAFTLLDHSIESELKASESNLELRSQAVKKIAKWLSEYSDEVGRSVRVQDLITRWKIPAQALGALASQSGGPSRGPIPNLNGPRPMPNASPPQSTHSAVGSYSTVGSYSAPNAPGSERRANSAGGPSAAPPSYDSGPPIYPEENYGRQSGGSQNRPVSNSNRGLLPSGSQRRPQIKPTDRQLMTFLAKFQEFKPTFIDVLQQLPKDSTLAVLFEDAEIQQWVASLGSAPAELETLELTPESVVDAPISQELRSLILEAMLAETQSVAAPQTKALLGSLLNRGIHRSWAQFSQRIKQAMLDADQQQDMEKFRELSQQFLDLQRKLKDFEDSYVSGKSIDSTE